MSTHNTFQTLYKKEGCLVKVMPYQLQFRYPFKLAHGTRAFTSIVILALSRNGKMGYGEAALPPYLGETTASVMEYLKEQDWVTILKTTQDGSFRQSSYSHSTNKPAEAALDIALHDLYGKLSGKRIYEMYGVNPVSKATTFTIGVSTEKELAQKLEDARDFKIIKLKLGGENDREYIKSYLSKSHKPFCVDVNQGWKSKEAAARLCEFLYSENCLFVEQPMPVDRRENMAWLKSKVAIPLIADESISTLEDLNGADHYCDGVNIKLMKCGGIKSAHQMLLSARSQGLKTVLGAMAQSSCGNTAAAHLAPLADWVDLDGPTLITNDPFRGIGYNNGEIVIPDKLGSGVECL